MPALSNVSELATSVVVNGGLLSAEIIRLWTTGTTVGPSLSAACLHRDANTLVPLYQVPQALPPA